MLYVQPWYGQRKCDVFPDPAAHLDAAMPARVEQHIDATVLVPDHDEVVLADLAQHVVALGLDLRLVRQENPAASEDVAQLALVDLVVSVDAHRHLSVR